MSVNVEEGREKKGHNAGARTLMAEAITHYPLP